MTTTIEYARCVALLIVDPPIPIAHLRSESMLISFGSGTRRRRDNRCSRPGLPFSAAGGRLYPHSPVPPRYLEPTCAGMSRISFLAALKPTTEDARDFARYLNVRPGPGIDLGW